MLSKRVVTLARSRGMIPRSSVRVLATSHYWDLTHRASFHTTKLLKDETVKVPQMAESISEGTLKAWQKKVGETVAADEEVATIETDKVSIVPQTSPMTSVHSLPPLHTWRRLFGILFFRFRFINFYYAGKQRHFS